MTGVGDASAAQVAALVRHLRAWLGAWQDGASGVHVVASDLRTRPGWDGRVRPLVGAGDAEGRVTLAVDPAVADAVADVVDGVPVDALDDPDLAARVGAAAGVPGSTLGTGRLRWVADHDEVHDDPADLGRWLDHRDPRVPDWLHPFGGDALVELDGDEVVAGVGVKRHDPTGHELAVVTDEDHRGRGLARRLVATAARRELGRAGVVTYLHAPDNVGSARVAEAVGLHDRGWTVLGLFGGGQAG